MPRCISSTSPDERSASRYFARRPSPVDGLALETRDEILRQRPAQVAAMGLDLGEARALHDRLQSAADGLDFGQFRHCHESPESADIASPGRRAMVLPHKDYSAMPPSAGKYPLRLPAGGAGRQAGAGRRRLSQRRAALRPHERSDVGWTAPGLEGARSSAPSTRQSRAVRPLARPRWIRDRLRCSIWPAAPATWPFGQSMQARRRPAGDRRRYQRRYARRGPTRAQPSAGSTTRSRLSKVTPRRCRFRIAATMPSRSPSGSATCRASMRP